MISLPPSAAVERRSTSAPRHRVALRFLLVVAAPVAVANASEGEFVSMMTAAMHRMHSDMTIENDGDPDRVFAAAMLPHHQGAIDMARAELLHGRDPRMRRLAQGIIVEQQQEIAVMREFLKQGRRNGPTTESRR